MSSGETPTEPTDSPPSPTDDPLLRAILGPNYNTTRSGVEPLEPTSVEERISVGDITAASDILPGNTWTHPALELLAPDDWAHTFFHNYVGTAGLGVLSRSARLAGVTPKVVTDRREDDAAFAAILNAAVEELKEAFEYVLTERNLNGTLKPQYQRGILVGYVREIDNRLLQWTLERLMPEKYHLATRFEMGAADAPGAFTFAMGEVVDGEARELAAGNETSEN